MLVQSLFALARLGARHLASVERSISQLAGLFKVVPESGLDLSESRSMEGCHTDRVEMPSWLATLSDEAMTPSAPDAPKTRPIDGPI